MLFNEILKSKYDQLKPLFDELFDLAIKHQTHSGDLLLVLENAHLTEETDPNDGKVTLYYNIGPTMEYHCETANHDFIRQYIRNVIDMPYEEYKALHIYSPDRSEGINELLFVEANSIQVEMLIYLKIWEGETFLKKIYQVSRLINGLDYDWHLAIIYQKKMPGGMERHTLIKKLKENLKKGSPALYDVFERIHQSRLRNVIAHSQYAMLGRNILLNNNKQNLGMHQPTISFDEWVDIFHDTLTVFTLYEMFFEKVKEYCFEAAKHFNLKKEVRVNRKFPNPNQSFILLYTREHFKDWSPYPGSE